MKSIDQEQLLLGQRPTYIFGIDDAAMAAVLAALAEGTATVSLPAVGTTTATGAALTGPIAAGGWGAAAGDLGSALEGASAAIPSLPMSMGGGMPGGAAGGPPPPATTPTPTAQNLPAPNAGLQGALKQGIPEFDQMTPMLMSLILGRKPPPAPAPSLPPERPRQALQPTARAFMRRGYY